jgi:hypothetical protein
VLVKVSKRDSKRSVEGSKGLVEGSKRFLRKDELDSKGSRRRLRSKGLGSDVSPQRPIKLQNGKTVMMKNLKLGDILINGSVVDAVMKIKNDNDPYYKINDILVTGSHYVKHGGKYVKVKQLPNAKPTHKVGPVVSCLVTSDHKIPVGDMIFWDWEDNLIPTKKNLDAVFNKIRSERRKINISV